MLTKKNYHQRTIEKSISIITVVVTVRLRLRLLVQIESTITPPCRYAEASIIVFGTLLRAFGYGSEKSLGAARISIACTIVQIINCMATEPFTIYERTEANSDSNGAKESQDRWLSFATPGAD